MDKRKRYSWYATDSEYELISLYVKAKGRSISEYIRNCALAEINRHARKSDIRELVIAILRDIGFRGFPTPGRGSEGI